MDRADGRACDVSRANPTPARSLRERAERDQSSSERLAFNRDDGSLARRLGSTGVDRQDQRGVRRRGSIGQRTSHRPASVRAAVALESSTGRRRPGLADRRRAGAAARGRRARRGRRRGTRRDPRRHVVGRRPPADRARCSIAAAIYAFSLVLDPIGTRAEHRGERPHHRRAAGSAAGGGVEARSASGTSKTPRCSIGWPGPKAR